MVYAILIVLISLLLWGYFKKKNNNKEDSQEIKPIPQEELIPQENKDSSTEQIKVKKVFLVENGVVKEGVAKYMPQGMQIFDENGKCVVDITTRITKYLGEVTTGSSNGSLVNDSLQEGDLWVVDLEQIFYGSAVYGKAPDLPIIKKQGNLLTWQFVNNGGQKVGRHFIYGIY